MFKRTVIVYLLLVSYALSQDEVLDSLYGTTGMNKLMICSEEAVDCEGALWSPRWVLTRSSCLYDIPLWQLAVIKGDKGCGEYIQASGIGWNKAHRVYASFQYPDPELDMSLLYLDGPFGAVERLVNDSLAQDVLKEYEPWLQKTVHTYLYGNSYARWSGEVAPPARMFITAGVLPSAALIIFFLFILFFTSPEKKTIAYETRVYQFKKDPSV